jgi:thiol:disulfide interchange protein DsbD
MNVLKGVFGFLFLGTAILMIRPVVGDNLWLGLWGALALATAYCGWRLAQDFSRVAMLSAPVPSSWGCGAGCWSARQAAAMTCGNR